MTAEAGPGAVSGDLDDAVLFEEVGAEVAAEDAGAVQADEVGAGVGAGAGRALYDEAAGGVVAEYDQLAAGGQMIVPARALDAAGWRLGADVDQFIGGAAGEAGVGVDAGVDEQEARLIDRQRQPFEPAEQLRGVRHEVAQAVAARLLECIGGAAGGDGLQLRQQPGFVVAEHHLGSGGADRLPHAERIGAAGEGVAGQQQAVASVSELDRLQQGLELGAAAVNVADEDGALRFGA